jgi:hypothetical protein
VEDLAAVLESLSGGNHAVKIILWARGMASSVGVQYVTQQQEAAIQWERTAPARRMMRRERHLRRQREREERGGVSEEEGEDDEEEEGPAQYVKFLVLDSPFTSLKEVVLEAAQHIDMLGE